MEKWSFSDLQKPWSGPKFLFDINVETETSIKGMMMALYSFRKGSVQDSTPSELYQQQQRAHWTVQQMSVSYREIYRWMRANKQNKKKQTCATTRQIGRGQCGGVRNQSTQTVAAVEWRRLWVKYNQKQWCCESCSLSSICDVKISMSWWWAQLELCCKNANMLGLWLVHKK